MTDLIVLTREVLRDANRCCVMRLTTRYPGTKWPAAGPWPLGNATGPTALFTLIGIAAARDAGVDTNDHTTFVVTMIDSLTRSHRSQPISVWPDGRKHDWTKALAFAKQMTALVDVAKRYEGHLRPGTWERLRQCVAFEAQRARIPYWKKPDGAFYPGMHPGDSKAEEVSWSAQLFHAATLLGIPGYDLKCAEAIRAAFSVPQDGVPKGYNVDADYEVENHVLLNGVSVRPSLRIGVPIKPHAEYQRAVHLSQGLMVTLAGLFGVPPPVGLWLHLPEMYDVLTTRVYRVEDGYDPPGGVIYQPDGSIYNPRGTDKRDIANVMQFALIDAVVSREHPDPAVRDVAREWCHLHMQRMRDKQLARQAAMGIKWDGRAFTAEEDFPDANQHLARGAAETYWTLTR